MEWCVDKTRKTVIFLLGVAVLLSAGICLGADAAPDEAELFEKAYGHYLAYQPDKAFETFGTFLQLFPQSTAGDAALFWQAKSLIPLNRLDEARAIFGEILAKFPDGLFASFAKQEMEGLSLLTAGKREGKPADKAEVDARQKMEAAETEIRSLRGKLAAQEKRLLDAETAMKKAFEEKADSELKLLEREALLEGIRSCKAEYEALKSELKKQEPVGTGPAPVDQAGRSSKEFTALQQSFETVSQREVEARSELESLKARLKEYDAPAVRIGKETYTIFQVIEESILSTRVLSRMNISSVLWRSGNPYEDFIIEKVLLARGKSEQLRVTDGRVEPLVRKFGFTSREQEYLKGYLLITDLVRNELTGQAVPEGEIRSYYEEHKKEYTASIGERAVKYLVVSYTKAEETDAASLAAKFHLEAVNGKSLENIYRSRPDRLLYKEERFEALPPTLRDRLKDLKDGETVKIPSDGQYIILQMHFQKPVFRPYEEVRDEIRAKLSVGRENPVRDLGAWLKELRKEAEIIK